MNGAENDMHTRQCCAQIIDTETSIFGEFAIYLKVEATSVVRGLRAASGEKGNSWCDGNKSQRIGNARGNRGGGRVER